MTKPTKWLVSPVKIQISLGIRPVWLQTTFPNAVFGRTWTDAEELLKEKSFFILSFVFLSEFVIRQVL